MPAVQIPGLPGLPAGPAAPSETTPLGAVGGGAVGGGADLGEAAPEGAATDGSNRERILNRVGDGIVDVMSTLSGTKDMVPTAPYEPAPGAIRTTFGAPGPYAVAATREAMPCDGIIYTVYNKVLADMHGTHETTGCYGVFPEELDSPVGAQLIYPANIQSMEAAPLIVLSPGIGTEPGMYDKQARLYASHGYVVALGYNFTNWFGPQMVLGAATAVAAAKDANSALKDKIDFSRTVLVGHSAGGGSSLFLGNRMDKHFRAAGIDFVTRGLVAINHGPSDLGLLSPPVSVPALILPAEHESIVPGEMDLRGYQEATGPAWLAEVKGSYHGTYLDNPRYNAYGALVVSFAEYLTQRTPRSVAVYEGENYTLRTDSELQGVERKGI